MKKLFSILIASALSIQLAPAVSARSKTKPKGDWETVKAVVSGSNAIAVKTKLGAMHYGLLQSADDTVMKVQLAGRDEMTSQTNRN